MWKLITKFPIYSPLHPINNLHAMKRSSATSWWRHQMETFPALLAICAGNSPVPGEFPTQRPVSRSFAVFFDLRLNKQLSKQSWGWWFETLSGSLWRQCNVCRRSFAWHAYLSSDKIICHVYNWRSLCYNVIFSLVLYIIAVHTNGNF